MFCDIYVIESVVPMRLCVLELILYPSDSKFESEPTVIEVMTFILIQSCFVHGYILNFDYVMNFLCVHVVSRPIFCKLTSIVIHIYLTDAFIETN